MFLCPDLLGFFSSFTLTVTLIIKVIKSLGQAYVCYQVAQCADNNQVRSLVNYLNTKLIRTKLRKLSSKVKRIYVKALRYEDKA